MSLERRQAIADIARRYDMSIIEDDPLGCLHPDLPPPIAVIAPDITWYVAGLTKGLAHGLRVAYLVGPNEDRTGSLLAEVTRLSHWFSAPISTLVVNDWIETGVAETVRRAIALEAGWRQRLAVAFLSDHGLVTKPGSLHGWLPLDGAIDRHAFVSRLAAMDVLVRPSDAFVVAGTSKSMNAVRISFSSPSDRDSVERGLTIIRHILDKFHDRTAHRHDP
jgi:DNA-binding transcriptional MocR family regulator